MFSRHYKRHEATKRAVEMGSSERQSGRHGSADSELGKGSCSNFQLRPSISPGSMETGKQQNIGTTCVPRVQCGLGRCTEVMEGRTIHHEGSIVVSNSLRTQKTTKNGQIQQREMLNGHRWQDNGFRKNIIQRWMLISSRVHFGV